MSRILVVDDDPDIRNLLAAYLRADGHSLEFAEDGVTGAAVARRIQPDLVLTDFQMPRMDGFALFNAVRSVPQTARVPVVMLTAHHNQALMLKALGLGLDDFVGKPVTREELNRVIAPLLKPGRPAQPPRTTRLLVAARSDFFGSVVCCEIGRLEAFMMKLRKAELMELVEQFASEVAQCTDGDGGWLVRPDVHHVVVGFTDDTGTKDHAVRALRCALKAVLAAQRMKPWLARRFGDKDLPEFLVAVGVHTGRMQARPPKAGRAEPGLKGDAVEFATLLAESNLQLRWSVAVSQVTAKAANFQFLAGRTAKVRSPSGDEVAAIEVKGFAPPPPPPPPAKAAPAPAPKAAPPKPAPQPVADKAATLVEAAIDLNAKLVTAAAAMPKAAPAPKAPPPAKAAAKPGKRPTATLPAAKPGKPEPKPAFAPPKPAEPPPPPPVDPFATRTIVIKLADTGIVTAHLTLPKGGGAQEVLKGFLINDDKKQTKRPSLHKFLDQYAVFRTVEHPNIARTTDAGLSATHLFVAQEYCSGGDLRNLIAQGMTPDDAIKALLRIAAGLKAAHARGFVHGDLRPANVMIREDGSFAIVDFALARVVEYAIGEGESGVVLRPPDYLPPEVINGQPADVRSDIYALGLLLHEMLTGKRAYASPDLSKVMMDQLGAPVPTLPAPLERYQHLLEKLMAKKLEDRFASVQDVMAYVADAKLLASA